MTNQNAVAQATEQDAKLVEVSFEELQSREENLCICHTSFS